MAEQDTSPNGAVASTENAPVGGATFTVEKIYLKDVSFEAPGAPHVFGEQGQPQLQLNLSQKVQRLAENTFEVVLSVTVTCTMNEKTAYLTEVDQAGVFSLTGFEERVMDAMLGIHCPNVLYPFARQAISDLIQNGGFPPFLLQPINFDNLYAETLRQRAQQAQDGAGLADAEAAGNA